MPTQSQTRPLGEVLKRAGLLSPAQLQVVLQDQKWQPDLRIGDILELRGWVKRDAIEFFAEQWPEAIHGGQDKPIGYYLQQAGLLDSKQVETLLQEQAQAGLRIGALAVLHGWLPQETLDWFLQSLAPEEYASSAFIKRQQSKQAGRDRTSQASQARSDNLAARTQPSQQETIPMAPKPPADGVAQPKVDDIPWVD
ncbi:hypothetical protein IQ254_21500 [Nodosilinea sp. LEGE 07088]|uniref:hypothetical protein n=1 Tax=Nodosilinea sp. LEGE 07088 TaxID=2777968 RepID=UPI0018827A07|nr:hypothetical protein [Nodosilinea sp. LEGE 07088]MBE9139741.1 hypothetical protein [Nodosilinea sp. LEGE 07088]